MSEGASDKDKLREWVDQMGPTHRRQLLHILSQDTDLLHEMAVEMATEQLRRISDERGMQWDSLSEADREHFLDLLVREDIEATQHSAVSSSAPPRAHCLHCGRDLTPHDLYRIYFSSRTPSIGNVVGKLLVVDAEKSNIQFPVPADGEVLIGRLDPNRGIRPEVDLSHYDPAARVSRKHARIMVRGTQFFIEDLGSANGTFINGRLRLKPQQVHALSSGDMIKIGQTTLQFLTANLSEERPSKDS